MVGHRLACWIVVVAALLAGCAGMPAVDGRPISHAEQASTQTSLGRFAQRIDLPAGQSGFWSLPQAEFALDARIELIRRAERAVDLQTYQIGNDGVGRAILKELRDAARRGVRVRLLVDDFNTLGLDRALLQLAAHDHVEVRLFNPFVFGRDSAAGRVWNLLTDLSRLNHRMHNKLFVVDGALAIAGGRNLTDAYFMLGTDDDFIDFEFLIAGALVPQLGDLFDRYWNHPRVIDIRRLSDDGLSGEQLQADFETLVATAPPHRQPTGADLLGVPAIGMALDGGPTRFRAASAQVYADDPSKTIDPQGPSDSPQPQSTLAWVEPRALQVMSESILISPYFLPERRVRQHMRQAAGRGVSIKIVSNGVAASDEPVVALAAQRHRDELLKAGVRLFEVNPTPATRTPLTEGAPPGAKIRLHAKMGIFDRKTLAFGSINLDPRSHRINTEIAITIESPALAADIANAIEAWLQTDGVYEVTPSTQGVQWRVGNGAQHKQLDDEPGTGWWTRLRLGLLYLLVPDEWL